VILNVLMGLLAAVVTFVLAGIVARLGKKYRLHPEIRARDVHTNPTPRLGGVAMFGGLVVTLAVASQIPFFDVIFADSAKIWALLGAALIIVIIGVTDDLFDLDWMIKLAGQILTAGLLAWQGVAIASLPLGGITIGSSTMSLILTIFAVVLVMNAVNFIDGLNGLVAGVAIIANGVFYLYSYLLVQQAGASSYFNLASLLAAIVVGVCVGFIPWNWFPARLFMGDGGAYLVGLLMATSGVAVTGQIDPVQIASIGRSSLIPAFLPILLPIAILVVPFLDFALAVTRRLSAGKSPFTADRQHLHHRLLDMGHSQLHAVLIFYAWTAVVSVGGLLFFVAKPYQWAYVFLGVGVLICTVLTLAPLSRRKRVEAAAQKSRGGPAHPALDSLDPLDAAAPAIDSNSPLSGSIRLPYLSETRTHASTPRAERHVKP